VEPVSASIDGDRSGGSTLTKRNFRIAALVAGWTIVCSGGAIAAAAASASAPSSEPTVPAAGGSCPGALLRPTSADTAAIADATICLINRARLERHLFALHANTALDAGAKLHSHEMRVDHFFEHNSASGKSPRQQVLATAYGHDASDVAAAQNIAWGDGSESTPKAIVLAWMESPAHRELLLSKRYHDVGVGFSLGSPEGSRGALYTSDLAARRLHR
jgi:uncharacterized protein YkwD